MKNKVLGGGAYEEGKIDLNRTKNISYESHFNENSDDLLKFCYFVHFMQHVNM